MNNNEIRSLLKKLGLKATPQRVEIVGFITKNNHSSAGEIKEHTDKVLPSVSFSTIYLTVNTLIEADIIIPVTFEPGTVRYDTNTDSHYHMICVECGKITEVGLDPLEKFSMDEFLSLGFTDIYGFAIHFFGKCTDCGG